MASWSQTVSSPAEHHDAPDPDEQGVAQSPIPGLVEAVWQGRRRLAALTVGGLLLSFGAALLIPNEYTSTVVLMPPDQQSLSNASILNALMMSGPQITAGAAGSLLSGKTPGQTAIGVLSSRVAQDDIVNRFDLRRVYHCKYYVDADKELSSKTVLSEDKTSGLVSISVDDRDRYRAHDIAGAYVDELVKLLNAANVSSAHLERVFLESRLKALKSDLDATSSKLSEFSSRNATLNPQTQGTALLEAASRLQGELITAQGELYGLKAQYSDDNVRVRGVRARIDELQSQLRKMGGIGGKQDGAELPSDQLYPSIRELPILGATYTDLSRQMIMREGIYETLTRQYELARVEEAKEIPTVRVLGAPDIPEKKSSPHRFKVALIGAFLFFIAGIAWIIVPIYWEMADDTSLMKTIVMAIRRSRA